MFSALYTYRYGIPILQHITSISNPTFLPISPHLYTCLRLLCRPENQPFSFPSCQIFPHLSLIFFFFICKTFLNMKSKFNNDAYENESYYLFRRCISVHLVYMPTYAYSSYWTIHNNKE